MSTQDHEIRRGLERAVTELAKGGVRLEIHFSEETLSRQAKWPAESSISEEALRLEVQSVLTKVRSLGKRLRALATRLPDPPEFELLGQTPEDSVDDIPPSVYQELSGTLACLSESELPQIESLLEHALAATPASLRAEWIQRRVDRSLGRLLSPIVAESESFGWAGR